MSGIAPRSPFSLPSQSQDGARAHHPLLEHQSESVNLSGSDWLEESDVTSKDLLMAITSRTAVPIFVEDIEMASPEIVNLDYILIFTFVN